MKQVTISLLLLLYSSHLTAQTTTAYDSTLAKKLGADEYGMKSYVLVLLKTGSYKPKNKAESDSLFRGHMANIGRLAEQGTLVLAGPFGKNELYRGLFVFNVKTTDDARQLCESDPAVKAGLFAVDILPWYCTAAVMDVNRIHNTIAKKSH